MSSKEHTITFSRQEVEWLFRRINGAKEKAEEIINKLNDASSRSEPEELALKEAKDHIEMLTEQTQALKDMIHTGMKRLGALQARKEELEDQLALVEEPHIQQKIEAELASLPKEEEYRVVMNRHSIKYVLAIVKDSIERLRTTIIPEYQKAPEEHFENASNPMSRSYYVNKHWRTKMMLEKIMVRLEKRL